MLDHGGRLIAEESNSVLIGIGLKGSSKGTSENIFILLLGEVGIIVSMGVGILLGIVPIVLPGGLGPEVLGVAV